MRNLKTAIGKLIPTTRANTTLLYEELLNEPSKDDYTPRTWAAYAEVRDRAEAMMASMFDGEGNPTDANTSANGKQDELEALAAELTSKREALDLRVSKYGKDGETRVKLMASALEELNPPLLRAGRTERLYAGKCCGFAERAENRE